MPVVVPGATFGARQAPGVEEALELATGGALVEEVRDGEVHPTGTPDQERGSSHPSNYMSLV